ncbi:MAG: hypothetical protein SF187_25390 [Deltaproteobacteria bacterium]|nr:hypothetical protein [Deltaproteobacteria bacterium]
MKAYARILAAFVWVAPLTTPGVAHAIRPFVTDDARVVGKRLAQLETWLLVDRLAYEHNALAAYGPTDWLELTAGFVHGANHTGAVRGYSISGPILQAKALIIAAQDNGWPGLAVAAGTLAPAGTGSLKAPGWGGFVYAAATESLWNEAVLIHVNLGFAAADNGSNASGSGGDQGSASPGGLSASGGNRASTLTTSGIGVQTHLFAGLHSATEVFYGDPFDPRTDYPAMQLGLRYIFNDNVQMDGTFGSTLVTVPGASQNERFERWASVGIRLVSPKL